MPKTELSDDLERRFESVTGQLDRLAREAEPWQAVRDQLISEAKRTGASARTIAAAAGVSHTYVAQLPSDLDAAPQSVAPDFFAVLGTSDDLDDLDRCSCREPAATIISDRCPHCQHDHDQHDQKGCHHAS